MVQAILYLFSIIIYGFVYFSIFHGQKFSLSVKLLKFLVFFTVVNFSVYLITTFFDLPSIIVDFSILLFSFAYFMYKNKGDIKTKILVILLSNTSIWLISFMSSIPETLLTALLRDYVSEDIFRLLGLLITAVLSTLLIKSDLIDYSEVKKISKNSMSSCTLIIIWVFVTLLYVVNKVMPCEAFSIRLCISSFMILTAFYIILTIMQIRSLRKNALKKQHVQAESTIIEDLIYEELNYKKENDLLGPTLIETNYYDELAEHYNSVAFWIDEQYRVMGNSKFYGEGYEQTKYTTIVIYSFMRIQKKINLDKIIYPYVAKFLNTTNKKMDRNIRNFISSICNSAPFAETYKYWYSDDTGQPSPKDFVVNVARTIYNDFNV